PNPVGDLKWAQASYDSIHGRISVRWEHTGQNFTLHITIPANTTATVYVPAKSVNDVTESGKPANQPGDIKYIGHDGNRALFLFDIGSGDYQFKSVMP